MISISKGLYILAPWQRVEERSNCKVYVRGRLHHQTFAMTWTIHGTREERLETTPSSEVCNEKSQKNALKQDDTNIPDRNLVCRHRVEMARPIRTVAHNCSGNLDLFFLSFFLSCFPPLNTTRSRRRVTSFLELTRQTPTFAR